MEFRVSGHIVTMLRGSSAVSPQRDLSIDFTLHGAVAVRQELAGHYYVVGDGDCTQKIFTFSSTLHPYTHSEFRQFVADVKLRRECLFNFEGNGRFTGFVYRNGVLTSHSGHGGNCMSVFVKCTDAVAKDLDELSQTLERYIELCKGAELETVEHLLKTMV